MPGYRRDILYGLELVLGDAGVLPSGAPGHLAGHLRNNFQVSAVQTCRLLLQAVLPGGQIIQVRLLPLWKETLAGSSKFSEGQK